MLVKDVLRIGYSRNYDTYELYRSEDDDFFSLRLFVLSTGAYKHKFHIYILLEDYIGDVC